MAELGIVQEFVQDNHSFSARNVLRGVHYQIQHPQGKLVRVATGEIFDVAVDLRRSSPTFGLWLGESSERTLAWNDSDLKIDWQLGAAAPILSEKDKQGSPLRSAEVFD